MKLFIFLFHCKLLTRHLTNYHKMHFSNSQTAIFAVFFLTLQKIVTSQCDNASFINLCVYVCLYLAHSEREKFILSTLINFHGFLKHHKKSEREWGNNQPVMPVWAINNSFLVAYEHAYSVCFFLPPILKCNNERAKKKFVHSRCCFFFAFQLSLSHTLSLCAQKNGSGIVYFTSLHDTMNVPFNIFEFEGKALKSKCQSMFCHCVHLILFYF
jgi:hypothetical protein